MTLRQLQRLSKDWQKKLGLQDWHISINFASREEMIYPGTVGQCLSRLRDHTAEIKIMKDNQTDYEIELAVIREHIHVLWSDLIPWDKTKAKLFERAVDQTAITLLHFKRENLSE